MGSGNVGNNVDMEVAKQSMLDHVTHNYRLEMAHQDNLIDAIATVMAFAERHGGKTSWDEIGKAMGMTRQLANKRYGQLVAERRRVWGR